MSRKSESQFISSVHEYMPPIKRGMYRMKNHNEYNAGIFDVWYSGLKRDLWVEYKFVVVPKLDDTLINPDLSSLQLQWGDDRVAEGRNCMVIVGCGGAKGGGVIFHPKAWSHPVSTSWFRMYLKSRRELANYIVAYIS